MTNKEQFPAFRLKILLTVIIVISSSFILSTLTSTVTMGLMHGVINTKIVFLRMAIESLSYGLLPGIIVGGIVLLYLQPFHKATSRLFRGEELKDDEKEKAICKISGLTRLVILTNIAVYMIEFFIFLFIEPFVLGRFFNIFFLNLATAFIFGTIQLNIINLTISKARSYLQIYHVEEKRRKIGILEKNLITAIALITFVSLSLIDASQQIIMTENHYKHIINKVISEELTLDQARKQYKQEAADMIMVSPDKIHFPYDLKESEEFSTFSTYAVYFIQLLIIGIILRYTSSLFQVRQLRDLQSKMEEIANGKGDLTKQVEIFDYDEVGDLTSTINSFLDGLRSLLKDVTVQGSKVRTSADIIKKVLETTENSTQDMVSSNEQTARSTADQVRIAGETTRTIKEMLESVNAISEKMETQSAFVEQTSSAINEMAANIQSVNQTTNSANKLSKDLVSVADDGGLAVNQSIEAVKKVEAFSDEINDMVTVITKISAQTNLLAMNAAIEAAHAGDSGRGFAVVATEVRNLAENSSDSAKQISGHIKEMVSLVNNGVELSEGAGQALNRVGDDVKRTSQLIQEVSAAMEEQAAGTKEVLEAITSLVASTHSIKDITKSQQDKNLVMNEAIEELSVSFRQIETAAEEQSQGTKEIQGSIDELKKVVLENEDATNNLDDLLKGFIL